MRWKLWIIFLLTIILVPLWLYEQNSAVPTADIPRFSHFSGRYDTDFLLQVTSPDPTAVVLLTQNGDEPTADNQINTAVWLHGPRVVVIRARLQLPDGTLGPIVAQHYMIGLNPSILLISLGISSPDLWDPTTGIYVNYNGRGQAWERDATAFFYDPLAPTISQTELPRPSTWQIPTTIRIHGNDSRQFDKKSFRLRFHNERLEQPFLGPEMPVDFRQLVLYAGGQDLSQYSTNWTLMRDAITSDIALELGGFASRARPALLFLNGQPWGIYEVREHMDERLMTQRFGIEAPLMLDTPAGLDPTDPALRGWQALLDYVRTADMASPEALAVVNSQIDLANFIDYHILQIYSANSDWPSTNYQLFRPQVPGGRWQWYFWDTNYTFGLQPQDPTLPYSDVNTNELEELLTFPADQFGAEHALLFQRLWLNEAFRLRFLTRLAQLLDTTLSAPAMQARIDAHTAELAPMIAYEEERWPHTTAWADNVARLRTFVSQRPTILRQQFGMDTRGGD